MHEPGRCRGSTSTPDALALIHDISPLISDRLAVWPGDTPPMREILLDTARGDAVTLSTCRATVHLGAHADAPSHYGRDADSIETRRLDLYIGTCRVVTARAQPRRRVALDDLDNLDDDRLAPRLLIRTGTYPDPNVFRDDFAALEPALIDHLAARGVRLVGIDTPSVDLFDSKDLPAHQMLLKHDLAVLEGLVLDGVPDGLYELIALPLRLKGYDASPVRAILRTPEPRDEDRP